jgi:hypothetical protein
LGFIFGFGMGRRMDEWAKSQHCLGIVAVNSDEGNGPKGRMNLSKADEGRRDGGGRWRELRKLDYFGSNG